MTPETASVPDLVLQAFILGLIIGPILYVLFEKLLPWMWRQRPK